MVYGMTINSSAQLIADAGQCLWTDKTSSAVRMGLGFILYFYFFACIIIHSSMKLSTNDALPCYTQVRITLALPSVLARTYMA